jgi:DNA-binding TFAR19-related protein (PDSD5 family)
MDENEMKALQAQLGEGGSQSGGGGEQEQEAKRAAEAEMKRNLLATVLDNGARERCR